jgi:iron complex transport system ATP-binding protein
MMRILRHLAHKERKTVMLSTHDINMALDLADSLWLVDKHIGMETGTTSALAESGALARYFASPGIFFDKAAMQFTIKK